MPHMSYWNTGMNYEQVAKENWKIEMFSSNEALYAPNDIMNQMPMYLISCTFVYTMSIFFYGTMTIFYYTGSLNL
jgi:hypothetical protein